MRVEKEAIIAEVPLNPDQKVSVIVAVYNIQTYIEKCVRSIMAQTYPYLEIILVDDGATDESGKICDKLAREDERIVVLHKQNGGLSDARNAGIAAATGEFLAFVDGDDWIDVDMYERMVKAYNYFRADVVAIRYRQIYKNHIVDGSMNDIIIFDGKEALEVLVKEEDQYAIQNAAWNKLYRREFLADDRFPVGKWYEDIVYTTKLFTKANRCVYLDHAGINYVIEREGSIMNAGINKKVISDLMPAYFEKSEYLETCGLQYLVGIHNYFIYKRGLLLYTQFRRSKDPNKEVYMKQLRDMLLEHVEEFTPSYDWQGANLKEAKKLEIFKKSPALFAVTMDLNDHLVVPCKEKLISLLQK